MTSSLLTQDDRVFLEDFQMWIRGSMEYAIFRRPPKEADLVYIKNSSIPYLRLSLGKIKFVTIGTLCDLCENLVQQHSIYEAWLQDVLQNVYRFSRSLHPDDAIRFIQYFKDHHGITDEDALAEEAANAVREAQQALFGSDDYLDNTVN